MRNGFLKRIFNFLAFSFVLSAVSAPLFAQQETPPASSAGATPDLSG